MLSRGWIALPLLALMPAAFADVTVDPLFGAGMVIQRDRPIAVWGRAARGERVDVSIAGRSGTAVADRTGRWEVHLHPLPAGGPYTLFVAGDDAHHFADVMVGDVWVLAGQSNMDLALGEVEGGPEDSRGADGSDLRLFRMGTAHSPRPFDQVLGQWKPAAPVAAREFSAVGWYFGRRLEYELDVPIGLIQCTFSGSPVEAWVEPGRLAAEGALEQSTARALRAELARPGALFNGMIHPLSRFKVRGVAWYQGESNVAAAERYPQLFRALVESWRKAWREPELFFAFVQLPNHGEPEAPPPARSAWAIMREAQATGLALPHTCMAVTIDIGAGEGLHPDDKAAFGKRLAGLVLADVYEQRDFASRGPTLDGWRVDGARVLVHFEHVGAGLTTTDEDLPRGFALAGRDRSWHWAEARIEGGDTVVVTSESVPEPVAVRYAWTDEPRVNLVGRDDLPAEPFRTDDWPYHQFSAQVGAQPGASGQDDGRR
jgi:sialate O-acetylesterase